MSDFPKYIIFGASGGIGSALCKRLATAGADIMLVARDADKLEALKQELTSISSEGTYIAHIADATKSQEVDAAFAAAQSTFGSISGVANLVGSIILKPAHTTTDDELEATLSINTKSAFYVLRAAAKAMMNTGGSIVLASTVAASIGLANHEAIATAKGAINGLTISAAATYAPKNIRVNAVAPGLVRTPLSSKITSSELALKASTAMHPLGRIGEPDDVAVAMAWLLHPGTTWVTGQIIGIDGGLGTVRAK